MSDVEDLDQASYSFFDRFKMYVCRIDFAFYIVLIIEFMLLLLATLSLLFADLTRSTMTVLLLDYVILGTVFLLTLGGIIMCRNES